MYLLPGPLLWFGHPHQTLLTAEVAFSLLFRIEKQNWNIKRQPWWSQFAVLGKSAQDFDTFLVNHRVPVWSLLRSGFCSPPTSIGSSADYWSMALSEWCLQTSWSCDHNEVTWCSLSSWVQDHKRWMLCVVCHRELGGGGVTSVWPLSDLLCLQCCVQVHAGTSWLPHHLRSATLADWAVWISV